MRTWKYNKIRAKNPPQIKNNHTKYRTFDHSNTGKIVASATSIPNYSSFGFFNLKYD